MASISRHLSVMQQVKRINKQLSATAEKCSGPVGDTLLTQAALVASEIRGMAPIDPTSKTPGALRDSVRVEEGGPTSKKAFTAKIKAGNAITNASGYNYARAVEFGTVAMPAQPFFFPIWRARKKAVKAVVRKAIKQAVRGVFS